MELEQHIQELKNIELPLFDVECTQKGCKRITKGTERQLDLIKNESDYELRCNPVYKNIIDTTYCGSIDTASKIEVINNRCVKITYCPSCIKLPDKKSCLRCSRKFQPGCKLRFLCIGCYKQNRNENGYTG